MAGSVSHIGCGDAGVEPERDGCVPEVVRPGCERGEQLCRCQCVVPRLGPDVGVVGADDSAAPGALGIANLMVIHRLSDLDAVGEANSEARNLALGLLADCSTKIIYAQESGESEKTAAALGLSSTEAKELPQLVQGEGLWRVRERAFVVRHLCTDGELELFDTNARMNS
jgi:hypothetical protein